MPHKVVRPFMKGFGPKGGVQVQYHVAPPTGKAAKLPSKSRKTAHRADGDHDTGPARKHSGY